jgi:hypothetical protein
VQASFIKPRWIIYIHASMSKKHFLQYAARYARRPPIAQRRILAETHHELFARVKSRKTCWKKHLIPTLKLVVYSAISPDRRPRYPIFDEENIQVSGGIGAIERDLERERHWFVRQEKFRAKGTSEDSDTRRQTFPR